MNEERLEAIYDFCATIPPQKARELIRVLRSGENLLRPVEYGRICGLSGELVYNLAKLLTYFTTPDGLAAALETGVFFQQNNALSRLSFVWSGSAQFFNDARKTEQVILDMINDAKEQIMLVSFAAYKIPVLLAALQDALKRGVKTRLILESSLDSCGQLTHDGKSAFMELEKAEFYHWPLAGRAKNASGKPAKLHAKCVISESSFLVTSANLTSDAITENIELGVFDQTKGDARKLLGQFELLIGKNILTRHF